MFQTKVVEKTKTYILFSINSSKNRTVYETMWKNMVQPDRSQMTVQNMVQPDRSQMTVQNMVQPDRSQMTVQNMVQPDKSQTTVQNDAHALRAL